MRSWNTVTVKSINLTRTLNMLESEGFYVKEIIPKSFIQKSQRRVMKVISYSIIYTKEK